MVWNFPYNFLRLTLCWSLLIRKDCTTIAKEVKNMLLTKRPDIHHIYETFLRDANTSQSVINIFDILYRGLAEEHLKSFSWLFLQMTEVSF